MQLVVFLHYCCKYVISYTFTPSVHSVYRPTFKNIVVACLEMRVVGKTTLAAACAIYCPHSFTHGSLLGMPA